MSVAAKLYELNMLELAKATGASGLPPAAMRLLLSPLGPIANVLAQRLAVFDASLQHQRLEVAARRVLLRFGAAPQITGHVPKKGPLLVIANHPGTYDALSLFTAIGREDLRLIVGETAFLRALTNMQKHFLFVPYPKAGENDSVMRAAGLRHAIQHLKKGGAILHFAAGAIEPDPAFLAPGQEPLRDWQQGTAALVQAAARYDAQLAVAAISGVHSRRAKRLWLVRHAEKRGITTLATLFQVALPGFRVVDLGVRFSTPAPAAAIAASPPSELVDRLQRTARELLGR